MEFLTAIVGSLVPEVAKAMFKKIKLHTSYVFHHKRRVENFETKVETLKIRRDEVEHDVDAAEKNTERIYNHVTEWLTTVVDDKLDGMTNEVKDLEEKTEKKCFIGLCPNFKSRYQLSKKAEKYAESADKLLKKGEFQKVAYPYVPPPIEFAYPKDFEAFDSRKQVFNEILEAVKDPSNNLIGVYGMPGVGKTTLVKEVAKVIEEDKSFHSVVMAFIHLNPDIQKIQDQLADILGLKFQEQSMTGRASRLYERLKNEKKILVILDDIWASLDLREVGIPFGDEHMGCTILMTSRDRDVLSNGMNAQKEFQIQVLCPEEAWDLFRKTSEFSELENLELRSIVTQVAEKCGGLPIAILTVARALKKKGLSVWKDALLKLNEPSSTNFSLVLKVAYSAIELSYNNLESEELKQTLLLCSLLGHDGSIQDLLKYARGLGLFEGVKTVEETRDRLLAVVSQLRDSCLLHNSYNNHRFDIHDLISDVTMSIASKGNRVYALRHEDDLNDWPDGGTMIRCEKINLVSASINKLPGKFKCPELTFFHVEGKDPSLEIPSDFFEEMTNIKVLDLTKMHFPLLPSSICLLANLRTLCLDRCELGDIAIIGDLKNLEILSLLASDIKMLPREIGQLIKLKLLDLSRCTKLEKIPRNVLSSLCRLEELYMGNSFVQWEAEGQPSQRSNASLDELKALSSLTTLDVHIPNARMIPKDLVFEKLQRYMVFIGGAWDWHDEIEYKRTLKLKLHKRIGHLSYGVKLLMMKAQNLYLDEMKGLEILLHKSEGRERFQQLEKLYIQNGKLIQYIIEDNDVDKIEFLQLKSLTLHGLPKLISFCSQNRASTSISPQGMPLFNGKIVFPKLDYLKLSSISVERVWQRGFHSMQNLTNFIIEGCGNLKHVLSYSMAERLQQLKCLEIIDCNSIQEIISREEIRNEEYGKTVAISFPRLNSLKLKGLQKLVGFCHEDYIVEFQSLNILEIEHCTKLKGFIIDKSLGKDITIGSTDVVLFNEKVAFPNLEKMRISHLRNVKRIWYNQPHGDSFRKLKELKVEYCDDLLNIFSSVFLGVFQRLEMLKVTDCASLGEVFDIEEACAEPIQLRELLLLRLPKMKHVWNKDPQGNISFQKLRVVKVDECWNLKSLFPFSIGKGLLHLETLEVGSCGVENIVSRNIEGLQHKICFEFTQLSFLVLWNLPDLQCFYPEAHNTFWPVLKRLRTHRCGNIKIFGQEESQIQQPLFLIEKVISQLEEVYFSNDDITMLCNGQFVADFGHVKVLGITGYLNESALFPSYFLQSFYNLEMLELGGCNFKEVSPYVGDMGEEKDMIGPPPKIKKLKLNGCYNITHLRNQDSQLDYICASIETLQVWHCYGLINLVSTSLSFQNLTTLDVWNCNAMAELITSSKAQILACLVLVKIRGCEMMTEIVSSEGDEATCEIIFRELKCLELHCLQSLKSFCLRNNSFKFPSLEDVIVSQCPRLKSFCKGALSTPKLRRVYYLKGTDYEGRWAGDLNATFQILHEEKVGYHGLKKLKFSESPELMDIWNRNPQEILDFKNLEFLAICNCNELRCIFNLSTALSLGRLQQIEIKRCNKMEQVIKEAEEATADNKIINIFPLLKSIFIESCPQLTSFYLGSLALLYPSLESIVIANCPNLTTFVSPFSRDEHKEVMIGAGTQGNKDDPDRPTAFFCDKAAFPNLEKMRISRLRNVKRIWYNQLHGDSFGKLKELEVEYCDDLLNIFPSFLVRGVFQTLEMLRVTDCVSLEEVFQLQGLDTEEASVVATQLKELRLFRLPKMRHVWNIGPNGNISFQNLRVVHVWECWSLKSLFPFSIAKGLLHLETLEVNSCGVENIVLKNIEGLQQKICFEFNQISLLGLWNLPHLKCFYPEAHAIVWPVLKKLKTYGCGNIKIFGQRESQIQPPLFLIEMVIPQLEEVYFSNDDIAMIRNGQYAADIFGHIKVLGIAGGLNIESALFLSYFIQRFYNLEMLELGGWNFKDLSPTVGDVGEKKDTMENQPKIKKLKLTGCSKITNLWKQDSQLDHICAGLETLEVWQCNSLINLSSASSSFQNLTTLDVWDCNGMAELITSLKAQSLVCLVTMRIRECKMITEIVSGKGDEETYEIIFRDLKCLELHCLQSLKSFCSGNNSFKFPSLEQVIVSQCPTLKSFCKGALCTPKLRTVYHLKGTDHEDRWVGDLNATVQLLHEEKLSASSSESVFI